LPDEFELPMKDLWLNAPKRSRNWSLR